MRNVKNIIRHELIGVPCEVVDAANKDQIGIKGTIIDETTKTVTIGNGVYKTVPKKGTKFRMRLDKTAVVEGNELVGRPENRIQKKIKKW
ncbi:MAG: ribonuclease P protein component 1 [Candidatus Aenigmarchaeota archaeon]|nr:ribonuclease P protein component 1 [Candidatus Aenigmarchaeota archaeon]